MKKDVIFVLKAFVCIFIVILAGAMFNFFPFSFMGKDIIVKEIAFCALLICTVLVICTRMILNAVRKEKSDPKEDQEINEK